MKLPSRMLWKTLALVPLCVSAQQTFQVADCDDLDDIPFSGDTEIEFTASPVSCESNHNMIVDNNADVTLTTSLEAMELVNIRFEINSGSTLRVQLPNLQWQSVDENENTSGAALYVADGSAEAYFEEDVTFNGCSLARYAWGGLGGAIANMGGKLVFEKSASVVGTAEGGGLYSEGTVEFHGEALFQDNKNYNDYNNGGGGIQMMGGRMTFKAAASFIGNEVEEEAEIGAWEGNIYYGGEGGAMHVSPQHGGDADEMELVFEGPVLFRGNKAYEGAGIYLDSRWSNTGIIFQDLVTFEDNEAPRSCGGAVIITGGLADFQAGVSATGNIAKDGGVFCVRDSDSMLNLAGSVSMTGNTALYRGGALFNEGNVTMPEDAELSGNTAATCPSIKNWEEWETAYLLESWRDEADGTVEFSDGSSYTGSSRELCYFGQPAGSAASPLVLTPETSDCDTLFAAGTDLGGNAYTVSAGADLADYTYLVLDSRVVSALQFEVGTGDYEITCATQSVIIITGGEEFTISSSASSLTMSNIRIEVTGHTTLFMDIPELTMTGIEKSPIGGATHVDKDSSLEFLWDVKFLGNTLAYQTDFFWLEYGGAALFNAGSVTFHQQAYFRENGQFEIEGAYSSNSDGGAVLNFGDIQFMRKTKFWYNFNSRGGSGGGIANAGSIEFHRRTVWRNNYVDHGNAEEGSWVFGGHGAGLYNVGPSATAVFHSKAFFKDNSGGFRGGAVAANGAEFRTNYFPDGANVITFEDEVKFKDNGFLPKNEYGRGPDGGGAGLWVYQDATVDFQDRVVFRRNWAANGGAIMNGGGRVQFASADLVDMVNNVSEQSCDDIMNYDTDLGDQENDSVFGDIDDPENAECGYDLCNFHLGEIVIGAAETIVGPAPEICEF
eukprot:g14167.t1